MYNNSCLQGNFVADPKIFRKEDSVVARFTLANNRSWGENRSVNFVDCVAFGKTAEFVEKYFIKGKQAFVSGELTQSTWENNEGQKRSKLEIKVREINFCGNAVDAETETQ